MNILRAAVASAALFFTNAFFAGDSPLDRWDAPHAANPILPGYYADPALVEHDGKFFLYATLDPWGGQTLGCWESTDFKQWTYRELNWPTKEACTSPKSSGAMVWAPSVVRAPDGRFVMYVSVGSEVWAGVADHPLGPWRDANHGRPLIPHDYRPGFHMIDAEAFIDDDGTPYLYWGSGWGWKNGKCFVVKLRPDMIGFDGEPQDVTPTNYFEGPFMFKHAGRYYLTYSQGITVKDTYAVHYAVGDTPFGPFTESPTSPILSTDHARNVVSPGHHALFRRGSEAYILYHRHSVPYVPEKAFRQICVDPLRFTAEGLIEKITPTHAGPAFLQGRATGRLAATATASSSNGSLHDATRATDDNYATRWAASAEGPAWLQLDLGAPRSIARQELRFEYAWKRYRFEVACSLDGQVWTTLADHREAGLSGSPVIVNAPAEARFLRVAFALDTAPADASVFEWSVFP
ncbi:MAG TPA: family 43 glycosylhydrolase [Opitutus sp.]|nr:family 43 glycosylhydrolase [Opitutus sp.]